jgi:redox-sensitive bicupin YhaK (pirin superfamily)
MSNLDPSPEPVTLAAGGAAGVGGPAVHHAVDVLEARKAAVGDGTEVRRLLPQRALRTIGAWCFLDHYGPDDVSAGPGMQVPPHPHTGLQTASWLFSGLVLHRDSLGSEQLIRPGELNLMTSGRGIAHSEESPAQRPAGLHGLQLWIALPASARFTEPGFAHHAGLPVLRDGDAAVTVVAGEYRGQRSPAAVYTPLVGLEITVPAGAEAALALRPGFEYGVLAVDGPATAGPALAGPALEGPAADPASLGAHIEPGRMAHLPTGGSSLRLAPSGPDGGRFFVVGGEPFTERLVMWWNFVARTGEEIAQFRADWAAGRFGEVPGYLGEPLAAPPLPGVPLRPR